MYIVKNQDDFDRHLSELPYAADAAFNSRSREHEPQCLADTRVDLLKQLMAWADKPHDKCIFWLNGMAGTGKSTIARTVARTFYDQDRLGASFFFSRGGGDLAKADKFFTTLAVQLAKVSPDLKRYICDTIARHGDIGQQSLRDQWKQLIFRPISMLKHGQLPFSPLILVIDALDECEHQNDIRVILGLLAETKDLNAVQLRVFVTSRPETPIRLGFRDISAVHQNLVLHNISQSIIEHDISIFLKHKFKSIREERSLPRHWPSEQSIELLVQRAGKLFIYAATVCLFVGDPNWSPEYRLCLVLANNAPNRSSTPMLDEMYTKILESSVIVNCREQDEPELSKRFRQIIGPLAILFDSLSANALAKLLDVPMWMMDSTLDRLRSVVDVPEDPDFPIRLLHPSFREFLIDEQRCLDRRFKIDEKKIHTDLVESCLKVMSYALKRDICGLQMPGALSSEVESNTLSRCLPKHVQYACRYWVDHLQRGEIGLCYDNGQVHKFLQQHFLHWIEALSLMGKISEGVLLITTLHSMLTVSDLCHHAVI
jgi:hypothetical protein